MLVRDHAFLKRSNLDLETKSGTGDLNTMIPASWKLIDFDKLSLFFGCSKSPQTECKLDSGKFWCATDLMCVLDCIGCSHRPVAVPSYNGNECTFDQIQATNPKIPGPDIMPLTPGDPDPIMVSSSSSCIGSEFGITVIVGSVVGIVCAGITAAWFCFRRRSTSNSNSSGHSSDVTNPGNQDSEAKLSKDLDADPGLVPHNFRGVQRSVARGAADPCVPGQMLGELVVAHVSVTVSV